MAINRKHLLHSMTPFPSADHQHSSMQFKNVYECIWLEEMNYFFISLVFSAIFEMIFYFELKNPIT